MASAPNSDVEKAAGPSSAVVPSREQGSCRHPLMFCDGNDEKSPERKQCDVVVTRLINSTKLDFALFKKVLSLICLELRNKRQ